MFLWMSWCTCLQSYACGCTGSNNLSTSPQTVILEACFYNSELVFAQLYMHTSTNLSVLYFLLLLCHLVFVSHCVTQWLWFEEEAPQNGKVTALLLYFCVMRSMWDSPPPPPVPQHVFIFHCIPLSALCVSWCQMVWLLFKPGNFPDGGPIYRIPPLICSLEQCTYNNNLLNVYISHRHIKEMPQLWRSLSFWKAESSCTIWL